MFRLTEHEDAHDQRGAAAGPRLRACPKRGLTPSGGARFPEKVSRLQRVRPLCGQALARQAGLLAAAVCLGALWGGVLCQEGQLRAEPRREEPPEHFKSGGARSEAVLLEIAEVLKRMDARLANLERWAERTTQFPTTPVPGGAAQPTNAAAQQFAPPEFNATRPQPPRATTAAPVAAGQAPATADHPATVRRAPAPKLQPTVDGQGAAGRGATRPTTSSAVTPGGSS